MSVEPIYHEAMSRLEDQTTRRGFLQGLAKLIPGVGAPKAVDDRNAQLVRDRNEAWNRQAADYRGMVARQEAFRYAKERYRDMLLKTGALRYARKSEYEEFLSEYLARTKKHVVYFDSRWNGLWTYNPIYVSTRNLDLEMPLADMNDVGLVVPKGIRVTGPKVAGGLSSVLIFDVGSGTATKDNSKYGFAAVGVWTDTRIPALPEAPTVAQGSGDLNP